MTSALRALRLFVVLAALVVSSACWWTSKSPTAPSGNGGSGNIPDQSKYEPLPATKPAVADDGTIIAKMRAFLMNVSPLRGSTVTVGPANCSDPAKCFEADLGFEFDGIDNPAVDSMHVEIYFSNDGKTPSGPMIASGGSKEPKHLGPWWFSGKHQYLLVKLSHPAGGWGNSQYKDPAEEGWVAFLLDYK